MVAEALVDTSIWIDFFRSRSLPTSQKLIALMDQDRALIPGIALTELLRGARNDAELKLILELLKPIRMVLPTERTWEIAGMLAHKLSEKGLAVFTVDAVIAAMAIEKGLALFSTDRHFVHISRHAQLDLIQG